jgi:cytochrome c-type biogenesis protein CcmH/NrfG
LAKNIEPIKKSQNFLTGEHWAIIIGISYYKDSNLNLKYAHRDAEELYNLLIQSNGGPFKEDHIIKLINEDATHSNIIGALRNFLQKPASDDLVLIYFSCHGGYDPNRPRNSYILPYDTKVTSIAGSAVPMREIQDSIRENLLSQKVIIIADTCHSAAIGGDIGRRSSINSTAIINKYFEELAKSEEGTALLTSAEANEVAFEDKKWGGGHGVFTHFLLEGLRGKADGYGGGKKDGIISIGELFEYVRHNVKENTEYKQHPLIGSSRYDRNLPLYFTNDIFDTIGSSPDSADSGDLSQKGKLELQGRVEVDNQNYLTRRVSDIKTRLHYLFRYKRTKRIISMTAISIIAISAFVIGIKSFLPQPQPIPYMPDVNILFSEGLSSYNVGQYSTAVDSFDKVLQIEPNNVTAQFWKGSSLYKQEKYFDAVDSFDKVLQIEPNNVTSLYFKSISQYEARNYSNAHESFNKLIQIQSNNIGALYYDGLSLYNLKKYNEAEDQFDRLLALEPTNIDALLYKGLSNYNLQRYNQAISQFDRLLALEPTNIDALLYKGLSLFNIEKYDNALAYYDRVLELDPNNINASKEKEMILQIEQNQSNINNN